MSKYKVFYKQLLLAVFCMSMAWGQGSGYLAQKLMVENDLRQRITDALSKIIDDRKYVIDVNADIEISGGTEEQITILGEGQQSPRQALEDVSGAVDQTLDRSRGSQGSSVSMPWLPGYPGYNDDQKAEAIPNVDTEPSNDASLPIPVTLSPGQSKVLSRTVTSKHPATAYIKKLEISIILQEGAAPELIENIRQVVMVASRFNRARGDALSIMTATFKERRDEKTAEQILLKNIAEKLESLEQQQPDEGSMNWKEELEDYKAQEADRREQDKTYFQQQLTSLESAARERAYQLEKRDILRRDSLKMQALNNEITSLKSMITSEDVSGDEAAQAEKAMGEKMSEKEALDAQIAEKLAMLDAVQSDLDRSMNKGGSSTVMIVFVSLLGALVIVLVVVLVIVIMGNRQRQQLPPPWMYPPRSRKKKSENKAVTTPQTTPPPPESIPAEDTSVLQSEISDMRQAVVSMSVSQPSAATRIVKEWMEDDTPPPEPVAAPVELEEKDSDKKKKKKKK